MNVYVPCTLRLCDLIDLLGSCVDFVLASDVFKLLSTKYKKTDLLVGASFFEIYSGKVGDQ